MKTRVALGGVAAALLAWAPLLASGHATGPGDWGWFHHAWEASRAALAMGEAPLWDPFHCGGVPLWGQPQSMHLAPTWWITGLLFGTARGSKLFVLLHATSAVAGAALLARARLASSWPGAWLSGLAWGLGGFFAWRVAEGHAPLLAFAWMPWVLLAFDRAARAPRYAALAAAALALMVLEGGGYPALFTALALAVETALRTTRQRLEPAKALVATLGLFALLAAARLWPIAVTLARYPRATDTVDAQAPAELVRALANATPPDTWSSAWSWGEHAASLTVPALALALLGALAAIRRPSSLRQRCLRAPRRRDGTPSALADPSRGSSPQSARARVTLALAVLFGALALGDHGPASPWPLLHRLPGFDNLHVPSRFAGPLSLYVALLAAAGLDALVSALRRAGLARAFANAAAWSVVLAVGLESVAATHAVAGAWTGPPIGGPRARRHHLVAEPYLESYASYPARNVGTASCYDPLPWPVPAGLREGDVPQAWLEGGEVHHLRRTSHDVVAEVTATRPTTLVVNQRFDADWRSDAGEVASRNGLLAVRLARGEHTVRLRHAPADLPWSLLLSALGLALCVMWWRSSLAGGARPE